MAGPKRQHFIPRSYLRNFATVDGDKAFLETMNIHSGETKYPVSIADICVSKNIYTLPKISGEDRFALERYYASEVDAIYPEVYRILTNDAIEKISESDREKILSTTLSLYFRTTKFFDLRNDEIEKVFSFIDNAHLKDETEKKQIIFGTKEYILNSKNADEIKEQIKTDNKISFLLSHLSEWQSFVRHKYHSQITVCKVTNEVPLITSDNPVNIYNWRNSGNDIFNPDNSIQLPLNKNYFLWISPNSSKTERNIIYRGLRDKWFAITSNHSTHSNASNFVIGNQNQLAEHFRQQQKYDEFVPTNLEAYDSIKFKAIELSEFVELIQKRGINSEEVKAKFQEMKNNPHFQSDPQFQIMSKEMKGIGI